MPNYQYTAANLDGKKVKGRLRANDTEDLRARLRADELFLTAQREVGEQRSYRRLKANQVAEFCRELGAMLGAGVALVRALNIMAGRDIAPRQKAVYTELYQHLQQGLLLSEAMTELGDTFPELLISMYRASEASGRLDITSQRMAQHYEKSHRLNQRVRSAMVYPLLLLGVTILVVLLLFIVILPTFFTIFDDMNTQLPAITQFMLALSQFLQQHWIWVVIGMLMVVLLCQTLMRIPAVRLQVHKFYLHIPGVARLLKIIYTARFARTLSSLYSSGITIITALQSTVGTVGNDYIASQFPEAIRMVRNGGTLSQAIAGIQGFDSKLASSIQIGEETGRLDDMLDSIAENFDYEADTATQRLTALVQPVMIIAMAIVIGTVMISVMMPLMTMYEGIGTSGL